MNRVKDQAKINYWINFFPEFKHDKKKMINLLEQTELLNQTTNQLPGDNLFLDSSAYSEIRRIVKLAGNENLFPEAFYPILFHYFKEFCQFIDSEPFVLNKEKVKQSILTGLMDTLSNFGNRSLVKDLTEKKAAGLLKGDTSEERFAFYADQLLTNKEYLRSFYKKYEALFLLLSQTAKNHFLFIKEVIQLTKINYSDICSLVTKEIHGIVDLAGELGDTHHDGKSVLIIVFDHEQKVIYKPRSVNLEVRFNCFLDLLNQQENDLLYFKTVNAINKGDYGWMEFVPHNECCNKDNIEYFYENVGQLTALLHFLNGKDFHHENIIASGKFPVLIDLKSLFHAEAADTAGTQSNAYEKVYKIFNDSVHSIGILPQCLKSNSYEEFISADIGGVSAEKDQFSPFKSNVIYNRYRDDIYIGKEYGIITAQKNNPLLNGQAVNSSLYVKNIQKGFTRFYDWVLANKSWFISQVENIFAGASNRYIAKPTFLYSQLLRISYNPEILSSIENRDVLLHRVGIKQHDKQKKLVKSEIMSLRNGNIPYFTTKLDDLNIYDNKRLLVKNYFVETPLKKVMKKIMSSNKSDKNFQLTIIQQIFAAKNTDVNKDVTNSLFQEMKYTVHQKKKWLALSKKIGNEILKNSISVQNKEENYITWLGVNFEGLHDEHWELDLLNNDLYLGNAGIALFLAHLGNITGDKKYSTAARAALNMVQEELTMITHGNFELVGAFNGISSYVYVLGKINEMSNGAYTAYIENKLPVLQSLIKSDQNYDIISGSSGCLLVLLSLYESCKKSAELQVKLLDLAEECFQHLKMTACFDKIGCHWRQTTLDPLVGFAHGNAGIIYSLTKLYEITEQEDILTLIQDALKYERQFYSPEKRGWRFSLDQDKISLGWCNGTPGILASRVALQKIGFEDEFLEKEIAIAIDEVKKYGFGNNISLCHGDLGNLEILAYTAQALNDQSLLKECLNTIQNLSDGYLANVWQIGMFKGTISYNLMVGLAGCGYSLLQAYKDYSLPKVLLLN